MSQTVVHVGKLKKVTTYLSKEDFFEQKCAEENTPKDRPEDTWESTYLNSVTSPDFKEKKYQVINASIYELTEHTRVYPDDDLSIFKKEDDGTISFSVSFYNGGACFQEVLDDGINELENE